MAKHSHVIDGTKANMLSTLARDTVTELGEAPALPRADAATVRALNRLYASTAAHAVAARGVGYRLAWCFDEAAEAGAFERYRFKLGAHVGHLGLDAPSVEALLGERRSDQLPRDLRYILVADALHPLVDALEKTLRLHFEWQPPDTDSREQRSERSDPLHAACFVATATDERASLRGFVQFDHSAALDTLVPGNYGTASRPAGGGFEHLRLPVSFCLGSTPIRLREVASIRPGDIVSIEQWSSSGAAIVVNAELGGASGRHLVGFAEGSRITVQHWKDSAMNRDMPLTTAAAPGDASDATHLPIDRLDALEVTLRFEVGELSLSLGELKSIRAGHVFDLGQPLNRSPVRILAHGNVLGKGHLVAVGDRLGVRVSEFAPNEI
jgi:type III secretion protein Q